MEFDSEEMSNATHDVELELLAKLVESTAKSVDDAAEIIRSAKIVNQVPDKKKGENGK